MATAQELTLEPGEWSAAADRWIGQALQYATAKIIRHQVEHCGASLFYILSRGDCVGAFVLRVDHGPEGSEGVIVAAAGHLQGVNLVESCLPAIEKYFNGCKRIRYHTARPALARRLVSHGYGPAEIVCMKELKNEPITA